MHSFAQDSPSKGGRDGRDTAYLETSMRPPVPPRHFVRRPRLLALLNELTEYPIALIVAPAGSGKTTLVADWLRRSGRPSAWLTLGPTDGSAVDLGTSLAAALERADDPGVDATPMTVVLDNVDRLGDDEGALAFLASLVESRRAGLRLLLISRRRPPLPVDRLRASGDLADVTFDALRFSEEEAALLLTRLCPALEADELVAAVDHADGWAAALQLTALALQSRRFTAGGSSPTDPDAAAQKLVDEYLWQEVLRRERPELVGLVQAAAVVGRINYGLAEALTERPDAGDLLEEAEAAGLFLDALPGGWFALHSLVRDTLLHRLERRSPDGLRKWHARAAQWFESRGDQMEALDHWAAAERPIDALRVLSEVVLPLLDAGDIARAADALGRIPADVVSRDPVDAVRYAWCQLAAGPSTFIDVLAVTESTAVSLPEPSASRLQTLRAASSWLRADWQEAATHARRVANQPADLAADDPIDCFGWRMIACGLALDERWDDRQPIVGQAWAASRRDPAARRIFESTRAVGLALAGHPLEASRVADGVRGVAGSRLDETLRVELALADAIVERELDHRDAAVAILEDLAVTPTYPDPILQVFAQLALVRLRLCGGVA
jgi:LuxR family maltose regulon positive regulatory protein